MALTLEAILEPVSEEAPTGEDLSYSNERAEIEQAFEQTGDGLDGEDQPERDWRGVLRLIDGQFQQTKDVWLAAYLARAGAESGDLEVVVTGVQALAGLFEQFWETVHPTLDELGVPGRKAPCDSLANRRTFIIPLERTVLIAHPRLGRFTGADLQRFASEGGAAEGYGLFRAALEEIGDAGLEQAVARLDSVEDGLRRADRAFTEGASGEEGANFQPTLATIAQIRTSVRSFLSTDAGAAEDGLSEAGAAAEPGAPRGAALAGAISSREEVIRAFGLIGDYYRKREPGHPMPTLLERAQAWVTMDFIALMRDIAPDGVEQAELVLRARPVEEED